MKKKTARKFFATTMLVLLAIGAIFLIVIGGIVFNYIFIEGKFFLDLSGLSLLARNSIIGLIGLVCTFFPIGIGIYLLILLIGVDNIMRFIDKIMN
jgi:hypothetical protein